LKPWWVYVLECRSGRLYTGVAVDPAARLALHQTGKGARFTRSDPPQRCLVTKAFEDRSTALKEEYRIKQLTRSDKLQLIAAWQREGCQGIEIS